MEIVLYSEVNLLCIAILLMVFFRDAKQRNNDTYHILFTRVLFSNILFFASDIAWGLLALMKSPPVWANWVINIVYFSISGITAYFWLVFVERIIDPKRRPKRWQQVLRMLPPALLILLSIVSIQTRWLFYIDAAGHYQRGEWYVLQPLLAYLLPLYATALAIYAARRTQNFEKKRQYRSLAMFYVLPCIGGIFQVLIAGTPMLSIGIALSGLSIYFNFQDNIIMLDPLTSLNNRRCFDSKLHSMIRNYDKASGKRLWLIMMDVDYFKKINDGFGHAEGDKALITIANTLTEVCGRADCVPARIGGDEFTVCCESEDAAAPERICSAIRQNLARASDALPFKLQISMGFAEYTADMTAQQWFVAADQRLYEAKQAR